MQAEVELLRSAGQPIGLLVGIDLVFAAFSLVSVSGLGKRLAAA